MNFRYATAIAVLTVVAACKPSEQRAAAGDTEQAGTQAAPAAAAAAAPAPAPAPANPQPTEGWTQVTAVKGFDRPESVWYDSTLDVYYISNTGSGNGDDSHGFISRVKGDGTIDSLRFIADGQNDVTLHTPRGLAVLGDTIWVADGKTLRGFDKNTGKSVGDIELSSLGAELLNDVALGPDGSVFVTDTRAKDGAGEIFRIPELTVAGRSRNPAVASTNVTLQGPNGMTWDRVRGRYLVVSFLGNDIYSWMPKSNPTSIAKGPGRFDGVAALGDGRILVTSWNDSSLMVVRGDSLHTVISGLPEPADIGIDNKRQRVAIPLSASNEVVIFTIPAATMGREVPRRVMR